MCGETIKNTYRKLVPARADDRAAAFGGSSRHLPSFWNPDRDTFLSVEGKVVVGFLQIPSQNTEYAILNTFDANTASFSLCRDGTSMPWDTEGMTVYGIAAFTKNLSELQVGDQLIFEDLAGTQYHYQYIEKSEEVIDHGIQIISSDKNKNEKTLKQYKIYNK